MANGMKCLSKREARYVPKTIYQRLPTSSRKGKENYDHEFRGKNKSAKNVGGAARFTKDV